MNNKEKFLNEKELNENKKNNNFEREKDLNELKPTKKDIIEEINDNFRTVLSYGTGSKLVPVGQFIVKDIAFDPHTNSKSLILEQIDDPSVNLILPKEVFIKFIKMAVKNSKKLNIYESPSLNPLDKVIDSITDELIADEFTTNLPEVEVLPLSDNNITLTRNGSIESSNYSICPINIEPLQKYLERERYNDSKEIEEERRKKAEIERKQKEEEQRKIEEERRKTVEIERKLRENERKIIKEEKIKTELQEKIIKKPLQPIELEPEPIPENAIVLNDDDGRER